MQTLTWKKILLGGFVLLLIPVAIKGRLGSFLAVFLTPEYIG